MFTKDELIDLLKAWIAVTIAFTILYFSGISTLIPLFIVLFFTVGVGFLLHELAHKFLAIRYGYHTQFIADNKMLIFMIVISFFGIVFAAPGGVYIKGLMDRKKNGLISLAGPLMNMILALIFLGLTYITNVNLLAYGFVINSWLGLFNMLPFFGLDGHKVLLWNKGIYVLALIFGIILTGLSYVLI